MSRVRSASASGEDSGPTAPKRTRNEEEVEDGATGYTNRLKDEDFVRRNAVLRPIEVLEESDPELRAEFLELHVEENRAQHRCDEYEHTCLIVRRGDTFKLTLEFDRPFIAELDTVLLQFTYGTRPQESKGTVVRLPILNQQPLGEDPSMWSAYVSAAEGNLISVVVYPGAEAIVGRYSTYIETASERDGMKYQARKQFDNDNFIVLFNPWCEEDQVYMEDEDERQEYVMNEKGALYQGSANDVDYQKWNVGQFEDVCLDAALYLLEKSGLPSGACSNPLRICRAISAMSNSSDDDGGVLEGRWTDTFPKGCTEPWEWVGSVNILEQFMKTKKTVKYGQCWVFSGIVTTLLRALGIPTRSVTNFESAHDNDRSVTIDYHWDEDGKPLTDMNDSIWNFHVWNESWFKRLDLPDGYDGWQAHDATPQEASEGIMRCGPASIKAIKEGNTYLQYDAPFIFAEVNGDKVHWIVKKDGSLEVSGKEPFEIGKKISTKAVGAYRRKDLTDDYKYPVGSREERRAVAQAYRFSSSRSKKHNIYDVPEPDVTFLLDAPEQLQLGKDLYFRVHMKNISDEKEIRTVNIHLTAKVNDYTGKAGEEIADEQLQVELQPDEKMSSSFMVCYDDVKDRLERHSQVTVYMCAKVVETDRHYAHIDNFSLVKPSLTVTTSQAEASIGEMFDVTVSFINPLTDKLTGGHFLIEAAGIVTGLTVPYKRVIEAGEEVSHTVTLKARRAGTKEIMASFSSDQMTGLSGSTEIRIKYFFG